MTDDYHLDPRFIAGVDMIRRTGALDFQIRYDDDQDPVVWVAVAQHVVGRDGRPTPKGTVGSCPVYTVGAALNGVRAVMKLCEELIDGGQCAHCGKPAMFDDGFDGTIFDEALCWTQWDPELATFRRSCE